MHWQEMPPIVARSHHIVNDDCEVMSQADGRGYTSKSRYRAELKARGMVELGNDRIEPKLFRPTPTGDVLRRVASRKGYEF